MTPSYTHRVLGGPNSRKLEAKGIEIDIPIFEIANYCKENNLGEVERTFCCYCKPSFGATAGPVTRCPCHKLPCVAHALCRKRAHHGAGCRRCKFHIPLAAPRTQVDSELLEQQKKTLLSRMGSLSVEETTQQAMALIRQYHEEEVNVLKNEVHAQGVRFEELQAWVSAALAKPSAMGKDCDYEIKVLKEKVSGLVGQFGQLKEKMDSHIRKDPQYEVAVLDEKVSALALQIGKIKERRDSHAQENQEYEISVLTDKVNSLALQFGLVDPKMDDTSNMRHEVTVLQDKVSALALQIGQVEDKIKDDAGFRQLAAKIDYLMHQQRQKGGPELVYLGNGRMGPRPDGFGAGPSGKGFY